MYKKNTSIVNMRDFIKKMDDGKNLVRAFMSIPKHFLTVWDSIRFTTWLRNYFLLTIRSNNFFPLISPAASSLI